jgi:hypothetical protein
LFVIACLGIIALVMWTAGAYAKNTPMPPSCNAAVQVLPGDGAGDGPALKYQDNGDGTFTDCNTKDMWEKKVPGGNGEICTDPSFIHAVGARCVWTDATGEWVDILNHTCEGEGLGNECESDKDCPAGERCGFAGYSDWCLPNLKRLEMLVDSGASDPASTVPGETATDHPYWSSTLLEFDSDMAWWVAFSAGSVDIDDKDEILYFVRAVRPCE